MASAESALPDCRLETRPCCATVSTSAPPASASRYMASHVAKVTYVDFEG